MMLPVKFEFFEVDHLRSLMAQGGDMCFFRYLLACHDDYIPFNLGRVGSFLHFSVEDIPVALC